MPRRYLGLLLLGCVGGAAAQTTIQANSKLVVVDVVVLDRAHRPVTQLNAGDFIVREDGVVQKLKSFEFHGGAAPASAVAAAHVGEPETQQPGIFTNAVAMTGADSLNVILLDTLNTQTADQSYVRSQVQGFLKGGLGGGRISVFALRNGHLAMLQGFTADAGLLKAAVNSKEAGSTSALLDDATGMGGDGPLIEQTGQGVAMQLRLRERYTLEAIDELAQYLGHFSGRKNLVWFAGAFPFSIIPDVSLRGDKRINLEAEEQLRATSRLLTESRIAVYPVDSHANGDPFVSDATNSDSLYISRPDLLAKDMNDAEGNEAADRGIMERMARETGGRAFYNTNGLGHALSDALGAGSSFYTLAYAPESEAAKHTDEFRKIAIEVRGQGYELSYRRGYFADRPAPAPAPSHVAATSTRSETAKGETSFNAAMRRGAPDAMQIVFKARVLPAGSGVDPSLARNNRADPKMKGPWRTYQVDIAADPRPIAWTIASDGAYQGAIEFAAVVYDDQGRTVNSLSDTVTAHLSREKMMEASRTGVGLTGRISVPVKGAYWLRIGIRDAVSNKMGTVELPVSAVKDLQPLSAAAR